MKEYLLSLLVISLAVAIVQILAPNAASSHIRLVCSLIFICTLAAPIPHFLQALPELASQILDFSDQTDTKEEYEGIANLATVNKNAGNPDGVKVDKPIIDLLLFGKEMYELTDGAVNIAMGSVLSI